VGGVVVGGPGPTHLQRLEHLKEEVGAVDPLKEEEQPAHWDHQLKPWESRLIISPTPAVEAAGAGGRPAAGLQSWSRPEDYDEDSEDMEEGQQQATNNGHPHLHDPPHHLHHHHHHPHPHHPHHHQRALSAREFFEPLSGAEEDHFGGGGPYSVGSGVQAGSSPFHDGGGGGGPPTPGGGGGHAYSPDQLMQHVGGGGLDGGPAGSAAAKKSTSRRNAWGNLSYADLITQAILSSPEKRLTLSQARRALHLSIYLSVSFFSFLLHISCYIFDWSVIKLCPSFFVCPNTV
jgi:hypothetical protein